MSEAKTPIAITLHYPKDGVLTGDQTFTSKQLIKKVMEAING